MPAGKYRHYVTIETPTEATNDSGEAIASAWTTHATVWVEIIPQTSGEVDRADTTVATITNRVETAHYVAGVTPKMRLVHGSRVMQIESVADPDGRRRHLVIIATEEVAT